MLMKRTPPQLPVWQYADRVLGAFNDKESSQGFFALSGIDSDKGKNIGLSRGATSRSSSRTKTRRST